MFPEYTDVHRALLQALMNHGSLEEDELKDMFKEIWERCKLKDILCLDC
jgi:hypothetical protein